MELRNYLKSLAVDAREDFAQRVKSSVGHLQNVGYGYKPCGPELAVLIEQHSNGQVTRRELRADWLSIWPELDRRKSERRTIVKAV